MARILRQSTQIVVRIGPFVDSVDGVTPETGITLGAADQAEALRAGTATLDISGATWAAVTGADGWYDLTLSTTATNTCGELMIVVQDASVCLPVFAVFQVVEEAVFDAFYAASATLETALSSAALTAIWAVATRTLTALDEDNTTIDLDAAIRAAVGLASANLDTQIGDLPTNAELATSQAAADDATLAAIAALNNPSAAAIADAVWDEDATAHQTQGTFGQAIGDPVADTGTIYKAVVTDATGVTVGTDTATILTRLGTPSDLGDGATVAGNLVTIEGQTDDISGLATSAALATVAGYLDTEIAAILADTNELQTDWVNGGRLDLLIDAIKAVTDAMVFGVTGALNVNVTYVNEVEVIGTGEPGDLWGPGP